MDAGSGDDGDEGDDGDDGDDGDCGCDGYRSAGGCVGDADGRCGVRVAYLVPHALVSQYPAAGPAVEASG